MAEKKILYFQHRRTNQCQALTEGSKLAKLLKKAPGSWGQIVADQIGKKTAKEVYELALGGSKEVSARYAKPVSK